VLLGGRSIATWVLPGRDGPAGLSRVKLARCFTVQFSSAPRLGSLASWLCQRRSQPWCSRLLWMLSRPAVMTDSAVHQRPSAPLRRLRRSHLSPAAPNPLMEAVPTACDPCWHYPDSDVTPMSTLQRGSGWLAPSGLAASPWPPFRRAVVLTTRTKPVCSHPCLPSQVKGVVDHSGLQVRGGV